MFGFVTGFSSALGLCPLANHRASGKSTCVQSESRLIMSLDKTETLSRFSCSRRYILGSVLGAISLALVPSNAVAAVKEAPTLNTYLPQIEAGFDTLVDLQKTWNEKTEGLDGDVVRRILGTVGVKSPLFKIRKSFEGAWKIIAESPDASEETIERVNELYNSILDGISGVDFQLYSVNFTELRPTKEKLIENGKQALDSTVEMYAELVKLLKSSA
mmetsp:Transcript_13227/g.23760  ORF Transcript_13227/g.23760 Transcript_13227/m.23760 type:complete len:216 (-) Transcript_13227:612-1259(-)